MGFQKAKDLPAPSPAPPPIRQSGVEALAAGDAERRKSARRTGIEASMKNPLSLLGTAQAQSEPPKKTLLGQ